VGHKVIVYFFEKPLYLNTGLSILAAEVFSGVYTWHGLWNFLKGMDTMLKRWISVVNVVAVAGLLTSGCATMDQPCKPEFTMRVNCAAFEPYTDSAGNVWLPDQYMEQDNDWGAVDGMTVDRGGLSMTGTDAPGIYETERYSMTAYKFKLPNGKYTVRLHFAETYEGIFGENERVFSVSINGKLVLEDFDPYKVAGGPQKPIVKEFKGIAVTDGELVIGFEPNIENPEINGIEIMSE